MTHCMISNKINKAIICQTKHTLIEPKLWYAITITIKLNITLIVEHSTIIICKVENANMHVHEG